MLNLENREINNSINQCSHDVPYDCIFVTETIGLIQHKST